MKKLLVLSLLFSSIFIVGCFLRAEPSAEITNQVEVQQNTVNETVEEVGVQEDQELELEEPVIAEPAACTINANCMQGDLCIDGSCRPVGTLNAPVQQEGCTKICQLKSATFSTSDGEEYTIARGEGGYSYAGAIEWKLLFFPEYCADQAVRAPITVISKNAGKILDEKVISLGERQTSGTITHPTIERVQFSMTLDSIEEECR